MTIVLEDGVRETTVGAVARHRRVPGADDGHVAVVGSVVALGARTPASSTGRAAGYRLVLVCLAGVAVAAAVMSLALPARRPTAREPASAPSRTRHAYPPARSTA